MRKVICITNFQENKKAVNKLRRELLSISFKERDTVWSIGSSRHLMLVDFTELHFCVF